MKKDSTLLVFLCILMLCSVFGLGYYAYCTHQYSLEIEELSQEVSRLKDEVRSLQDLNIELETKETELNKTITELKEHVHELQQRCAAYEPSCIIDELDKVDSVPEITANDIVEIYNTDKQLLKDLSGREIIITGKVKGYTYGETIKTGGKSVTISPKITLDNDSMQSFTGIHCYGVDSTMNRLLVDNEGKLSKQCTVRIKGLADMGITFTLSECSIIEILDDSGEVIDSWNVEKLSTESEDKIID